jgi:RHS repeat-associated protein
VQAVINPLGFRTTTVYDGSGAPLATIDALGFRTTTVYDAFGRVQTAVNPLGARTTTVYDGYGRVQATIDPRGYRTTTLFDSFGRAAATQDALGYLTTTLFDSLGRAKGSQDAAGFSTDTSFDLLDRPEARIDALGYRTTTVFAANGAALATIDALGRRTTMVYDSVGRALAEVSALGYRNSFTYSLRSERLAVMNPRGYTQSALYDALGRASVAVDALGRRTTVSFDPTGNLIKQTDAKGQVETRTYDALGRPTGTVFADGTRVTVTFDALGRALTQKNQNGTWTRTYDAVGRALTENAPGHPFGHPLTSIYDLAGNRTNLRTWRGRQTWTYDARNQTQSLLDIEGGRSTWSYDARGLISRLDYPNAAWMTATYDAPRRTLQIRHARSLGQLAFVAASYDPVGNVATLKRPNLTTYSYDAARQLVSENHKTRGRTTWSYDPAGNRVTALLPANQRITWSYDAADQLTLEQQSLPGETPWATTTTFSYDPNGNRTLEQLGERFASGWSNATVTYPWDPANHLLQVLHNVSTGTDQTATYRPDGLRAKKGDGGATQHMIWDGNDLLAQVDASGNTLNFYSRGATLVKQRNPSGWTSSQEYLHLDPQGSVLIRSKSDNSASSTALDPDPWGGDPTLRWGRSVVDSFTRADADSLGQPETGGGPERGWTEKSAPGGITPLWGIRSGRAQVIASSPSGTSFWAYCDTGPSDVRVKVRLTVGGQASGVGLFFRGDGTGAGLVLQYIGESANNWQWAQLASDGTVTVLATVTGPVLTGGKSHDLEVRANGSSCSGYANGTAIGGAQTITAHQTGTAHGLYVKGSNTDTWENYSVEAEEGPLGWLAEPGYYTERAVMRPLEYVRARWYVAGGPGWLSKDPIGLGGGDVNLYRYVGNNPLTFADPSGLKFVLPPGVAEEAAVAAEEGAVVAGEAGVITLLGVTAPVWVWIAALVAVGLTVAAAIYYLTHPGCLEQLGRRVDEIVQRVLREMRRGRAEPAGSTDTFPRGRRYRNCRHAYYGCLAMWHRGSPRGYSWWSSKCTDCRDACGKRGEHGGMRVWLEDRCRFWDSPEWPR